MNNKDVIVWIQHADSTQYCNDIQNVKSLKYETAAVAQSVRAFTPQAEGKVFESQPQHT